MGRNNSAKHGSKPKNKPNRHQRRQAEIKESSVISADSWMNPDLNEITSKKVARWLKVELGIVWGFFLGEMHCERELHLNQEQIDAEFIEALKDRGFVGDVEKINEILDFLVDEKVVGWREAPALELGMDDEWRYA